MIHQFSDHLENVMQFTEVSKICNVPETWRYLSNTANNNNDYNLKRHL